jgi:hypothetical protein
MNDHGLQTGENGRDTSGRFAPGAAPGPGRPPGGGGKQAELRRHLMESITPNDVSAALQTIRDVLADPTAGPRARLAAADLLLNRAVGKASDPDLGDLIASAEEFLNQRGT